MHRQERAVVEGSVLVTVLRRRLEMLDKNKNKKKSL